MTGPQSAELRFLIYVAVFIGVLLAFDGLRQFLSRTEDRDQALNRRMRMRKKGVVTEQSLNVFLDKREGQGTGGVMAYATSFPAQMRQAGLHISARWFILGFGLLGAVLFVGLCVRFPVPVAALVAVSAAIGGPVLVIGNRRRARMAKLTAQLPDALDLMARGLQVGHPLSVTVASVASDMPDPIGSEFGIIQDQVSYGDDIVTAFNDFAERVDIEDARYLAVSVGIQHGTGGNMARILKVLSKVIRDRAVMHKKIHAISSEGRLSAVILTCMPLIIFATITITSPGFYGDVKSDPLFMPIMASIISLIVLQGFILIRMVNFKF
ncbi:type II secretion system F family protein [Pseudogemmobacter sp. W21_MBD1_M6]|uniref:type II secretion system F family protein n=1 Tax=Pseudogemmobacter sp. W21_MBD1_M6 TaxID=3240271 RepID=UPI003F9490C9